MGLRRWAVRLLVLPGILLLAFVLFEGYLALINPDYHTVLITNPPS